MAKGSKYNQESNVPYRDGSKVPEWNTYYPSLGSANPEQRRFYALWKNNLEQGIVIDIDGNLSYLFVYAYDAIYRFVVDKEIGQLIASFERLQKGYSNYNKITYLDHWLADAWLYLGNYDEAWRILREQAGLSFSDILNIRARCSDTTIDGNVLLRVIGFKVSTKIGRERREKAVNLLTTFLADFHQKNGMNFVEHFCKQFNLTNLTKEDIDKLETFFPDDEEFLRLKLEWQYETSLFIGVPFAISPITLDLDPKTREVQITTYQSIQQRRIASLQLPNLVERAINQEIKKLLQGFEKRDETGSSAKRTKKKRKKAAKSPVSRGGVVKENLPYPVVYYPNSYGTFFGFAKDESSRAALCLCSKPAIENLIRLKREHPRPPNVNPLRRALFDSWFFPDIIANIPIKSKRDPLEDLCFVEGLCHRCNLKTPRLRYCPEMYGGEFIQHYGWYVNQEYLRLGIYPMHFSYLKDVCLPEYQKNIDSFKKTQEEYQERRLLTRFYSSKRDDRPPDEITYWPVVKMVEAKEVKTLHKIASQKLRSFTTKIENIVRQEFGFRNVGEGWVSETLLYQIVKRILSEEEILRHHRPDWLEGLELDVFVPSQNLAFEYQGQQHFHAISLWGGAKGLQDLQERDKRKAKLCARNGIDLVAIEYTEPLTENYICKILEDNGYFDVNKAFSL
jgi:hypothetical protein